MRHIARSFGTKVDYYYAQAATNITYWETIQAHALLPGAAGSAREALRSVAGLASVSCPAGSGGAADASWSHADALAAFHPSNDGAADDDFPPRVCFLAAGCAADASLAAAVASRGALLGVHVPLRCTAGETEWAQAEAVVRQAKRGGLQTKVLLQDALAVDSTVLGLVSARACDAGADVLTIEALGAGVSEDDLWDAADCMRENDVVGVPMAMRLGVRLGHGETAGGADLQEHVRLLVAVAATELQVLHFDVCPLGLGALTPAALAEALEEAGVDNRLIAE
eukprot:g4226.t1